MNDAARVGAFLARLVRNVWTLPMICALAAASLAFSPGAHGPALPHEATHPGTCRACAWSPPEMRAARDAWMIGTGTIEAPNDPDGLPGRSGSPPTRLDGKGRGGSPLPRLANPRLG